MTTEACTTKLAYLFGRLSNDPVLVAKMLTQDIRGEVSDTTKMGIKFFGATPSSSRNLLMRL